VWSTRSLMSVTVAKTAESRRVYVMLNRHSHGTLLQAHCIGMMEHVMEVPSLCTDTTVDGFPKASPAPIGFLRLHVSIYVTCMVHHDE
jgi:hypothetical protein